MCPVDTRSLGNFAHFAQSTMNGEANQQLDQDDTIGTATIQLLDITPMDYFSKTQTPFSQSSVFRDELWRRRQHRQSNGFGEAMMSSACGDYDGARTGQTPKYAAPELAIETVLTRKMSQVDLKKIIEQQMVEARKLMQMFTARAVDGSTRDSKSTATILRSRTVTVSGAALEVARLDETGAALVEPVRRRSSRLQTKQLSLSANCHEM